MILNKRSLVLYKSAVKKMLTSITKFGTGDGCDVYLYNYISKDLVNIYPVLILNQEINPWNSSFYPSNLFITDISFPENINIFKTDSNSDYYITPSIRIDVCLFKKYFSDIKELEINQIENGYEINFTDFIDKTTDRDIGYVDKFYKKDSLKKVIEYPRDKFNIINDIDVLKTIHSEVSSETVSTIYTTDKGNILKIFYSVAPLLMDKLEYIRLLNVSDNEVTSTVYMKQTVSNIVIHNFYKFVDIWNLITKKD